MIEVKQAELACKIMRHATFSTTGQPIDPHMPQLQCERLYAVGSVRGCAKPIQLVGNEPDLKAEACAYI